MIINELVMFTGGELNPKTFIRAVFTIPCDPKRAKNPMATTMVGITNGKVEVALRKVFPGNSYLANRKAVGSPTTSVSSVDTRACQMVNQIRPI